MPKRRGHGEGSIYKTADGLWRGSVDLGRGPDGKRQRRYISGQTRRDVQQKLGELQQQARTGELPTADRMALGDYLARWLEHAKTQVRRSTWRLYEGCCRVHITPALGGLALARLTPLHLQDLYRTKTDGGLSPVAVRHIHGTLLTALNQAVKWQLIARNPAVNAEAPRIRRKPMQALTSEQSQKFLAALEGNRLQPLYLAALGTGMRLGELLGLRWADVDLDRRQLRVVQTLLWAGRAKEAVFEEPKTASSQRTIALSPMLVAALRKHRAAQAEERLKAGEFWTNLDLVFCRGDGTILRSNQIYKTLRKALEAAGCPRIRFHDLRHSHASLLLEQGVHPKVVSDRLGHSAISITLDRYSHVAPDLQRAAAEQFDALLKAKNPRA